MDMFYNSSLKKNSMTPQQKGTLYERLVCERLKARARKDHQYVSGNDVREHHFVQLYKTGTLENRLLARKQLALLQCGKRLRGKNGSVLIGVDLIEVKLPEGVLVVRQLDMKYTEKDVLPFANIGSTNLVANMNGLPTTIVSNAHDWDSGCKAAAAHNPRLQLETVVIDLDGGDDNVDTMEVDSIAADDAAQRFVPRDYQVKAIEQLRTYISELNPLTHNKILGNFLSAFGKSHMIFVAMDLILQNCDFCFILVSSIECAEQLIQKFELYHAASSDYAVKNMTTMDDRNLKHQLRDPPTMARYKTDRIVPIMFWRTFEEISVDLDLTGSCGIFDEVHKYPELVASLSLRICIGFSARKCDALCKKFEDNVLQLDDEDMDRMTKTAFVPKIIIRIDARSSDGGGVDDPDDIEEHSRRIINAYNYSTSRQAVFVIPSNDCVLDDFDEMRQHLYDRMKETNDEVFVCEWKRLHGPKRDVHTQFFCEALKKKLSTTVGDHVHLDAEELRNFPMTFATQNSVVEVNGQFWVAAGFEIVRQDSKSSEQGFTALRNMLHHDHSGAIMTKQQFFEGQDFKELGHTILAGRVNDPHLAYQLIMRNGRICKGKAYAMLTSVCATPIDVFAQALAMYDPRAMLMQLEYFDNLSLTSILARSDVEWSSTAKQHAHKVASAMKDAREKVDRSANTREQKMLKATIEYLEKNHKAYQPGSKYLQLANRRIDWRAHVERFIAKLKPNFVGITSLAKLSWLPLNESGGMFDVCAFLSAETPLVYSSNLSEWPLDNFALMERLVEETQRETTVQRGMYSIVNNGSSVSIPVHLMCSLHRVCSLVAGNEYACPPWTFCQSIVDAPARRIKFDKFKKLRVELPKEKPAAYNTFVAAFRPILEHPLLRSCLYDLNCSFASTHDNVAETLMYMHKWALGYSVNLPYSKQGRKSDPLESPQRIDVSVDDFSMASDVYEVYEQIRCRKGKIQHHNVVQWILSKLFYVQLMIFFILYHWSPRMQHLSTDEKRECEEMFALLKRLKIHSAHTLTLSGPTCKKARV
jgi:hypothetical protein